MAAGATWQTEFRTHFCLNRASAFSTIAFALGFAVLLLAGCSKSAGSVASRNSKLFQSAQAEIKAAWETASAAAQTNGFSIALIALSKVQTDPSLTAEQGAAVRELSSSLSDKMYEAANKGDPGAKAALQELRKLQSR